MATTLTSLLTRIRQRSNMENSQFCTDEELTYYINASLSELDDILIDSSEDYKLSSVTSTISTPTRDSNYFTLPDDFLKDRGVDRDFGGTYITLMQAGHQRRNNFAAVPVAFPYGPIDLAYAIEGNVCRITPYQSSAGSYQLWYVAKFTDLVDGTDTLPVYMDTQAWCEYAIVDCCIKILMKDNLDPSGFMAAKSSLQNRIINSCKPRSAGPPKTIQNTRFGDGGRGRRW